MKDSNANGEAKSLAFNGWDFESYCLQLKIPVRIPKILVFFLVRMRSQCSFPVGKTGDEFWAIFSSGEGFLPGL